MISGKLLISFVFAVIGSQAATIVTLDSFEGGCSGTKTSIPFGLGNVCQNLGTGSMFAHCSSGSISVFSAAGCQGSVQNTPMNCLTTQVLGVSVGLGFSCQNFPGSSVYVMQTGDSCTNNTLNGASNIDVIIVSGQCLQFGDLLGPVLNTVYQLDINGQNITYNQYLGTTCSGSPEFTVTSQLGKCSSFSSSGRLLGTALGRALQELTGSGAMVITSAPTGSSSSVLQISMSLVMALMISVAAILFL